jgi:DNA primase
LKDLKWQLKQEEKIPNVIVHLPSDFDYGLPSQALEWLRKYGITNEEIARYRIGWSDARQLLVLPVFDDNGNLVYLQTRYFGQNEKYPKYVTSGESEKVFAIMDSEGRHHVHNANDGVLNKLVLVEDFISAIRVSRSYPAMPLFGSNLSIPRIRVLSDRVTNLVIWLDRDKLKEAVKARFKALPYFDSVTVIVKDLDPKEYTDDEIRSIIGGCNGINPILS